MNKILAALLCGFASTAMAQLGGYLGPGVMSSGAGSIGQRSGETVDLRFYADVMGVYDNGIEPFALNSQGQLYTINGLYGEQVDVGLYGQHSWRQALLGLDFRGSFYNYDNASEYDGGSAFLNLGYTYQKTRRLIFNFHGVAGTSSLGYGSPGYFEGPTQGNVVGQQSALLFDNRIYYLQAGADVTYLLTPRTSFTIGGDGYEDRYQAAGLIGLDGYSLRGSIRHRLSRTKTIGATYERMHYTFVHSYGNTDINMAQGFFATALGKRWTLSISAGGFQTQVAGVEQISLNPVIAALLGQSFGYENFYRVDYYPAGEARLTGKFKTSEITFLYGETVVPGNGVYLTSRQNSGGANFSYTGIRKWNFGASGAYYKLNSVGQNIRPESTFGGGLGFTYNLTRSLHIVGRYDYRRQDIESASLRRDASRVTFGLAWSPGDIPLSLW